MMKDIVIGVLLVLTIYLYSQYRFQENKINNINDKYDKLEFKITELNNLYSELKVRKVNWSDQIEDIKQDRIEYIKYKVTLNETNK